MKRTAGDFQMRQAAALLVRGDLEHLRRKRIPVGGGRGVAFQALQKFRHALQFQRRAKVTGEQLPSGNAPAERIGADFTVLQKFLHERFFAHGGCLQKCRICHVRKIQTSLPQTGLQLRQHLLPLCAVQVHLIDEQEYRHFVMFQQLPQGFCMALHAVRPADDQHRSVQHLHNTLRFRRKVHVSRRIQQCDLRISQAHLRLMREDRDAACPLHGVGIQKCVTVIYPSQLPNLSCLVEHCLRQRGFS